MLNISSIKVKPVMHTYLKQCLVHNAHSTSHKLTNWKYEMVLLLLLLLLNHLYENIACNSVLGFHKYTKTEKCASDQRHSLCFSFARKKCEKMKNPVKSVNWLQFRCISSFIFLLFHVFSFLSHSESSENEQKLNVKNWWSHKTFRCTDVLYFTTSPAFWGQMKIK